MWLNHGIDLRSRTVQLCMDVDAAMLEVVARTLHQFRGKSVRYILTSDGGDVTHGLAICDLIRRHKGKVTVEVLGHAESMAAVILQAADVRLMHTNAYLMVHQGVVGSTEGHKRNIKAFLKLSDVQDDVCDNLVISRIQEKHPKYSWTKFREESNFDTYFDASQAVRWGLCDKVLR